MFDPYEYLKKPEVAPQEQPFDPYEFLKPPPPPAAPPVEPTGMPIDSMLAELSMPRDRQYNDEGFAPKFWSPEKKAMEMEAQRQRIEGIEDPNLLKMIAQPVVAGAGQTALGLAEAVQYPFKKIGEATGIDLGVSDALHKGQQGLSEWSAESGAHPLSRAVSEGVGGMAVGMGPMIGAMKGIAAIPKLAKMSPVIQRAIGMGAYSAVNSLPQLESERDGIDGKGVLNYVTSVLSGTVSGAMSGNTLAQLNKAGIPIEKLKAHVKGAILESMADVATSGVETGVRLGTEGEIKELGDLGKILDQPSFWNNIFLPLISSAFTDAPQFRKLRSEIGATRVDPGVDPIATKPEPPPRPLTEPEADLPIKPLPEPQADEFAELSAMAREVVKKPVPDEFVKIDDRQYDPVYRPDLETDPKYNIKYEKEITGGRDYRDLQVTKPEPEGDGVHVHPDTGDLMSVASRYVRNHIKGKLTETELPNGGKRMEMTVLDSDSNAVSAIRGYYRNVFKHFLRPEDGSGKGEYVSDKVSLNPAIQIADLEIALKDNYSVWKNRGDDTDPSMPRQYRIADDDAGTLFSKDELANWVKLDADGIKQELRDIGRVWDDAAGISKRDTNLPIVDRHFEEYAGNISKIKAGTELGTRVQAAQDAARVQREAESATPESRPGDELKLDFVDKPTPKPIEPPPVKPEPARQPSSEQRPVDQQPAKQEPVDSPPPVKQQAAEPQPTQPKPKRFKDLMKKNMDEHGPYTVEGGGARAQAVITTKGIQGKEASESESSQDVYSYNAIRKVAEKSIAEYRTPRDAADAVVELLKNNDVTGADETRTLRAVVDKLLMDKDVSRDEAIVSKLEPYASEKSREAGRDLGIRSGVLSPVEKLDALISDTKKSNKTVQGGKVAEGKKIQEAGSTGRKFVDALKEIENIERVDTKSDTIQDKPDPTDGRRDKQVDELKEFIESDREPAERSVTKPSEPKARRDTIPSVGKKPFLGLPLDASAIPLSHTGFLKRTLGKLLGVSEDSFHVKIFKDAEKRKSAQQILKEHYITDYKEDMRGADGLAKRLRDEWGMDAEDSYFIAEKVISKFGDPIKYQGEYKRIDFQRKTVFDVLDLPNDLLKNKTVQAGQKKKSVSAIIKDHYVDDYNSTKSLESRIVDAWGVDSDTATTVSAAIYAKFGSAFEAGAKPYVEKLIAKIKNRKSAADVQKEINDALRRGVFTDEHAADAIAEALGIKGFNAAARKKYADLIKLSEESDDPGVRVMAADEAQKELEFYTPRDPKQPKHGWIKEQHYARMFQLSTLVKTLASPLEAFNQKLASFGGSRLADRYLAWRTGSDRTIASRSAADAATTAAKIIKDIPTALLSIWKGESGKNDLLVHKLLAKFPGASKRLDQSTGVDESANKMFRGVVQGETVKYKQRLSESDKKARELKEAGHHLASLFVKYERVGRSFVEAGDRAVFEHAFSSIMENQIKAFLKSNEIEFQIGDKNRIATDLHKLSPSEYEKLVVNGKPLEKHIAKKFELAMEDMIVNSIREGKAYTLQLVTKSSDRMQRLKKLVNHIPIFGVTKHTGIALGDATIPFFSIIGKMASRAMDFSPAGFAKSLYQMNRLVNNSKQLASGKTKEVYDKTQRQVAKKFGEGVAGVVGYGVYAAINELGLWLSTDLTKEEREYYAEFNFRPGTLNKSGLGRVTETIADIVLGKGEIGNVWEDLKKAAKFQPGDKGFNTDYLPIMNVGLGVTKASMDAIKEPGAGKIGALMTVPFAALTELFDVSATKNVSKVINSLTNRSGEDFVTTSLEVAQSPVNSWLVPGLIASHARVIDGGLKDLKKFDPVNRLLARVPFASEYVENKVELDGEEMSYFKKDQNWASKYMSMAVLGDFLRGGDGDNKVVAEMMQLARMASDSDDPTVKKILRQGTYARERFKADKPISIGSYKAALSPEQAKEANLEFLKKVHERLDKEVGSSSFGSATVQQKSMRMATIIKRTMHEVTRGIHKKHGKEFFKAYVEQMKETQQTRRELLSSRDD